MAAFRAICHGIRLPIAFAHFNPCSAAEFARLPSMTYAALVMRSVRHLYTKD